MEINMAKVEKEEEISNLDIVGGRVLQNCRCYELEERSKKAELRCGELEIVLQKERDYCEVLEAKVMVLEREKFELENELRVLKMVSEGPNRPEGVICEEKRAKTPIIDLKKDNEAVVQLMTENKVLECQKERAQSEFEVSKDNYKFLESQALQSEMGRGNCYHEENGMKPEHKQISNEGNMHIDASFDYQQNPEKVTDLRNGDSSCISPSTEFGDMQLAGTSQHNRGTPSNGIFHRTSTVLPRRNVRKQLTFETNESPNKKLIPSLTVNSKSTCVSVIDISDSEEEEPTQDPVPDRQGSETIFISKSFAAENGKKSHSSCAQNNEEKFDFSEEPLFVANTKRKRTCNVVTSESESDDEDNMPISKLKRINIQEASSDQVRRDSNSSLTDTISEDDKFTDNVKIRRRLRPLSKCSSKRQEDKMSSSRPHRAKHQRRIPRNDDADDDQSVEDFSYSEGESMSNFIVNDSDVSDSGDTFSKSQDGSNGDADTASSNLQDESDGEMNFGEILSKIRRSKNNNEMKWEYEADMLAAFGKDPELCMKAVCSLYRQQTSEEQMSKEAIYQNNRGFSKFDAHRGSALAEFLTGGDPSSGLKKSVEELQEYDPKAVELCRTLAIRYSKQLYEIYKNNEDPFFP